MDNNFLRNQFRQKKDIEIENHQKYLKLRKSDEQLRDLIEFLPNSVLVFQDERIVYANSEAKRTLGAITKHDLLGLSVDDLLTEEQKSQWNNHNEKIGLGKEIPSFEYQFKTLNGKTIYLESRVRAIDFNGSRAIMAVSHNITARKKLEIEMKEKKERYKSLFEHNANSVFSFDLDGYFTSCNRLCENLVGYSQSELLQPMNFYTLLVPAEKEKASSHFELCKGGLPQNFQTVIYHKEGRLIHLNVTIVPINVNGNIEGVYGIAQDITREVEIAKENEQLAYYDYLTGLPNRNMLNSRLSRDLINAREQGHSVAILFIDLDRFKLINETMGHNMGDLLLKKVANRLESIARKNDTVIRQGGDEFILILPQADPQAAKIAAERVLDVLSVPVHIQNYEIYTSPSIGISIYPKDGDTAVNLVRKADFALYQAKASGKNNYKFYSIDVHEVKGNPLKIEMDLHKAIERQEFLLHYQPRVNLKSGKVVGVEALIRWDHPELGLVSPANFIPIAEETGLIIPIGEWALYEACKQNKHWHDNGFTPIVSVNLSLRQFTQSNLIPVVARVLRDTGLPPECLELEITESMTADIKHTIHTLQELKKLGVRISIDDFGTGFSSLNYLKRFPVDTLKVDQSFVRELYNNPSDETIVKTIIAMAHNLQLQVVAEGIETREQLVFLQQHLCDEGQGYFFAKPMPKDQILTRCIEIEGILKNNGISLQKNKKGKKTSAYDKRKGLKDEIKI